MKTKIVHVDHLKQLSSEEKEEQHNVPNNDSQRQAIVLMKMNKNLNILKTNIPDLDVLSSPLLDFLKIGIRFLIFLF